MTTTALTDPRPQQAADQPKLQKWNLASIAIIAFAVGAVLTNFMMRHVFEKPIRVGSTEFQYFSEEEISRAFQRQFATRQTLLGGAKFMGVPTAQNPLDLWITQEIIAETKPTAIIETGTGKGGATLALASFLDQTRQGVVHSIDLQLDPARPQHDRIRYHAGSSVDAKVVAEVRGQLKADDRVMVMLDSSHEAPHVLKELKTYAPLVSVGSYLVVHNTQLNGHPLAVDGQLRPGVEGPFEAVEDFLQQNHDFEIDHSRERYGVTDNPNGWLKRVR